MKKKSAAASASASAPPVPTIESLLDDEQQQEWDTVRKRLRHISNPKRIGDLLYHACDKPTIPDDIFETLLAKLDGKREYQVAAI